MNGKTLIHKPKLHLSLSTSQFPSSFLVVTRFFSASSPQTHSQSSSPYRRHEEDSKSVKVSVWWDFENCHVPAGVNVFRVAQMITAAVRGNGIKGPVQITAFGDMVQLARSNQEALSFTGVNLTHIPHGGKNSADRSLLVDLMFWVSQNPPPAHIFLISGDRDFASVMHRLRMHNYNILLATTDTAPGVLCSAATIMWPWNALVRGESLTGRYFNQPPDGPNGSWYGYHKVPLEDPFAAEQLATPQIEELPESSSETKARIVPKPVVKQIRHILSLYPKGISITDLRLELSKSNVGVDKELYGYKRFTRFLLSMPHILRIEYNGDKPISVHGVSGKAVTPLAVDDGKKKLENSKSLIGDDTSTSKVTDDSSSSVNQNKQDTPVEAQSTSLAEKAVDIEQPPKQIEQSSLAGEKVKELAGKQLTEDSKPPADEQESEAGVFRKIWRRWFGSQEESSETKEKHMSKSEASKDGSVTENEDTLKGQNASSDIPEKKNEEKFVKSPSPHDDSIASIKCSSPGTDSNQPEKIASTSESHSKVKSQSLFSKIIDWCKFWRSDATSSMPTDQPAVEVKQTNLHSEKRKLSSEDSFWEDMESFIDSKRGLFVVLKSKTREQLAQNLQKEGPFALRSLDDSDILHLVNVLISEKKWVEERPNEISPFKIIKSSGKNSLSYSSHASNGLRSLFWNSALQSELEKRSSNQEDKGTEKRSENLVSHAVSNTKPTEKSRSKVLLDCQKLLNELVKEMPEGYDMVSFKKLFREKYGYPLEVQKLGYKNLASLVRQIPGITVGGTYVFSSISSSKNSSVVTDDQVGDIRSTLTSSVGDQSDVSKKDDEDDSSWEELGPVENVSAKKKDQQYLHDATAVQGSWDNANPSYEPSLSGDDLSDSDEESSVTNRVEAQAKPKANAEDSSLLDILDSWYSSKESDKSENMEGAMNSFESVLHSIDAESSSQGTKNETPSGRQVQKQRHRKKYSFVADPKDNLIEGILSNLNKSNESRMQS